MVEIELSESEYSVKGARRRPSRTNEEIVAEVNSWKREVKDGIIFLNGRMVGMVMER